MVPFKNPYRPGAGHMPPYLAGRTEEQGEFRQLLHQDVIMENVVLTGLRGVGKTVLLEVLKPIAREEQWMWVGTDLSEAASLSEANTATRLLADLATVTSSLITHKDMQLVIGFDRGPISMNQTVNYEILQSIYQQTPGLASDKLKKVLETVWSFLKPMGYAGVIFAYDEAQTMSDHSDKNEYPLSLLLDVFQSIQRKGIPFMLVLTGLPTLFPKLVEARTFSERMFHVIFLDRLSQQESREAIMIPVQKENCPVSLTEESIRTVCDASRGYPYFLQFICKEVFDIFIQKIETKVEPLVPIDGILRKLDVDFFSGRWAKATDRQRDLLWVAAHLGSSGEEFAIKELVEGCKVRLLKPIKSNHISQLLAQLTDAGLVYKGRHGKYSFAVPLMEDFIRRQPVPEGAKFPEVELFDASEEAPEAREE